MKEEMNCKDGVCEFNIPEEEKEKCTCSNDCECGCQEGKECTCNDDCKCDDGCCCGDECHCNDEVVDKKEKKFKFKKDKSADRIKELEEKEKVLEDALLRSRAEFVNYRKRLEEEQVKFMKYANEDLVKEVLPIIDNFERAISLDDANLTDELSKFLSGFKMTYCSLVGILEKFGVQAIDGNNKPFDANYHQAVITDHIDGMEPGMVIDVLQKGYLLKGKVIRHAMVKVSE